MTTHVKEAAFDPPDDLCDVEISVPVADTIASWRRVFAGRNGADPRDLLRKAAAES